MSTLVLRDRLASPHCGAREDVSGVCDQVLTVVIRSCGDMGTYFYLLSWIFHVFYMRVFWGGGKNVSNHGIPQMESSIVRFHRLMLLPSPGKG